MKWPSESESASGGWPFPRPDPALLWEYVDAAEALDVDSIWLSDRIVSSTLGMEPLVALSFIAARTTKLKFGTSVLALPLRNPTVLAKEIATLDFLSEGRVLPAVGLGTEDEREFEACGAVSRAEGPADRRGHRGDAAALVRGRRDLSRQVLYAERRHGPAQAGPAGAAPALDRRQE